MREIGYIALAVLLSAASWHVSRYTSPEPAERIVSKTDTVYVDKPIPAQNDPKEPETVTVYKTVRDTVVQCISRPTELDSFRVAPIKPIEFDSGLFSGRSVLYRSYNPGTDRWQIEKYNLPEPTWILEPQLSVGLVSGFAYAKGVAHIRYKRYSVDVGYFFNPDIYGPHLQITLHPFTLRY